MWSKNAADSYHIPAWIDLMLASSRRDIYISLLLLHLFGAEHAGVPGVRCRESHLCPQP